MKIKKKRKKKKKKKKRSKEMKDWIKKTIVEEDEKLNKVKISKNIKL